MPENDRDEMHPKDKVKTSDDYCKILWHAIALLVLKRQGHQSKSDMVSSHDKTRNIVA
jgi:hypothetical protein